MEVSYKNSRQEEFAALMQTVEDAGFKPADVARWLGVTPGAVSQYRSGNTTPKASVLELLKRQVEEKIGPKAEPELSPAQLHDKLVDLERFDPAGFDAARATIQSLHSRLGKTESSTSSSSKSGASGLLKRASASLNKRGGDQSP